MEIADKNFSKMASVSRMCLNMVVYIYKTHQEIGKSFYCFNFRKRCCTFESEFWIKKKEREVQNALEWETCLAKANQSSKVQDNPFRNKD